MYKKYFKLKGTNMFDQGGAHTNGVVIHEAMKTYRGRDVQEMYKKWYILCQVRQQCLLPVQCNPVLSCRRSECRRLNRQPHWHASEEGETGHPAERNTRSVKGHMRPFPVGWCGITRSCVLTTCTLNQPLQQALLPVVLACPCHW